MVKVKVKVCAMFLVLIFSSSFSSAAQSPNLSENAETGPRFETAIEGNLDKYHLVTLSSTNKKKVDAMCIKFLSLIPKAMLIPTTEESTVYRLIAATFEKIEPAKKRKAELLQYCESPFVVKGEHGYTVIAGSQLTEASALAEQKRLAAKNISTTILELRLPLKHWQMRSTESFDIRDAVIMANRLVKIGVISTLEPAGNSLSLVSGGRPAAHGLPVK